MKRIPTFIALMTFLLMAGFLAMPFGAEADASVSVETQSNHLRAYSTEQLQSFFTKFDLTTPQTLTSVAGFADKIVAADFSADDAMIYAFNETKGTFVTIDPATGSQTEIAASLPMSGTWTGLATDARNGKVYASSANCATDSSWLSMVNPLTGATTMIGAISGAQCIQALAVDASGQLWGVDTDLDELFKIDSATGAGTSVGATGVDAAPSAGLDVDYTTNILYMTILNASPVESRFHTLNTATGAVVSTDTLGSSDPGGLTNLGWLAISGQLPLTCGSGLPTSISANNTFTNTTTVTDSRYLMDLNLYISATHTSVGDLIFDLKYSDTTVSLLNRPNNGTGGCTGDNLDMTFDDEAITATQSSCADPNSAYIVGASYQPSETLSAFDMNVYSGTWTIEISNTNATVGSLNDWCLDPTFAAPGITLEKTVSTDGSCGTESEISVFADTEVTYCYTVKNVGNITLTKQSLLDSVLGTVMSNTLSLGIGESLSVTQAHMITTTTTNTNTATWTAGDPSGLSATADAEATVTVIPPTCSAPNVSIPDFNLAGLTDTLTLTDTGVITDINVMVKSEHPWVSDLSYTLSHLETGVSVTIIDRPGIPASANGCNGDDINAILDDEGSAPVEDQCADGIPTISGTFTPTNALSAFDMAGVPLSGTWELNVSDATSGETGTLTEWCLVAETGEPEITVDPMSITDTLGLNDTSTHPLTITNSGNAVLSWYITSNVAWATVDMMTGTVSGTTAISNSSNLTVTFNSTGVTTGTHTGMLWIHNNDSDEDPITVPLTLTVEAMPADIEVEPASLASTQLTNEVTTQTLTISNTGDITLTWAITITNDLTWAAADMMTMTSGTTAMDQSSNISVTFDSAGLDIGIYTATLAIGSDDPDEEMVTVTLTLTVTAPAPEIEVSPTSLTSTQEPDTQVNETLTISNTGEAVLTWTITISETWATASPMSGTTAINGSSHITVTFNSTDVDAGTYTGTLSIGSNDTDEPMVDVSLMLTVAEALAPEIEVSPTELASTQYPDTEVNETLTISNTGEAALTWTITITETWASASPMSGTIAAGGSDDITVTFDSTNVVTGTYTGILSIDSNDSDEATVIVRLTLTVEPKPEAEAEIEIPAIQLEAGEDLSQTLTISNTGEVTFTWEAFTENTTGQHAAGACSGILPDFPGTTLDPENGATPPGEASDVMMEIDTSNVATGDYTGNACVRNTDTGDVIAIPLTMTVTPPTAVEMAELNATRTSYLPLALTVAAMMLVLAGGYVVRRRRTQ